LLDDIRIRIHTSDPDGPKTCGSGGSGFGSGTLNEINVFFIAVDENYRKNYCTTGGKSVGGVVRFSFFSFNFRSAARIFLLFH
jgi:hypothetical protein